MTCADCCLFVLALVFPPLGVLCARGCGCDLLINICLTILGFVPGIIHACYCIMKREEFEGRNQQVRVVVQQNP